MFTMLVRLRSDGARACEAAHVTHGLHLHSVPGEVAELHPEGLGVLLKVQPHGGSVKALLSLYFSTYTCFKYIIYYINI